MINRSLFAALAVVGISLTTGCCGPCGWYPGKNLGRLFNCNGCGPLYGCRGCGQSGDACDCQGNWMGDAAAPAATVVPTPMAPTLPSVPPENSSARLRSRTNTIRSANYNSQLANFGRPASYGSQPASPGYRPTSYRLRPTNYSFEKSEFNATSTPTTTRYATRRCSCGRH